MSSEAVKAIRALHYPVDPDGPSDTAEICHEDGQPYPCRTLQVIDALGEIGPEGPG